MGSEVDDILLQHFLLQSVKLFRFIKFELPRKKWWITAGVIATIVGAILNYISSILTIFSSLSSVNSILLVVQTVHLQVFVGTTPIQLNIRQPENPDGDDLRALIEHVVDLSGSIRAPDGTLVSLRQEISIDALVGLTFMPDVNAPTT